MKTAGQILQSVRLQKKLDFEDIARITKIRPNFLINIESDDYSHLPSGTVARGFIRNYSEFLGLKPEYILAVFRRDFVESESGRIIPRGLVDPVAKPNFWTPRTTIIAAVTLLFVLFGAYVIYQYRVLTGPPALTISAPVENFSTESDTVEIVGKTDPEAAIYVNNQLISLEKGGRFSFRIALKPGVNKITVVSNGKSGHTTVLTRTVTMR